MYFPWLLREELKHVIQTDEVMQDIKKVIHNDWLKTRKTFQQPYCLIALFQFQRWIECVWRVSIQRWATYSIIPKHVWLHSSHIGINGCMRRVIETTYWTGMTSEIKEHVSTYKTCSKFNTKQQKAPLMSHKAAERPYLVSIDYFSNSQTLNPVPW